MNEKNLVFSFFPLNDSTVHSAPQPSKILLWGKRHSLILSKCVLKSQLYRPNLSLESQNAVLTWFIFPGICIFYKIEISITAEENSIKFLVHYFFLKANVSGLEPLISLIVTISNIYY